MPWTETAPRIFTRPAGIFENGYLGLVYGTKRFGREDLVVTFAAKIHLEAKDESKKVQLLQSAWTRLRYDHPTIAVTATGSIPEVFTYKVPDDYCSLSKWLEESFIVHTDDQGTAGQAFADLDDPCFAQLHYFPRSSELLLNMSHVRIDGVGAAMLFDRFFQLVTSDETRLSDLKWGNETSRLTADAAETLGVDEDITEQQKQWANSYLNEFFQVAPGVGLPYSGNLETPPGRPARRCVVFNKDSTLRLVDAAKDAGLTVTSAVHAALLLQTYETASNTRKNLPFMDGNLRNIRPYLPEPYRGPTYAAALAALPVLSRFPPLGQNTFKDLAKMTQQRVLDVDARTQLQSLPEIVRLFCDMANFVPPIEAPLPCQPMITSLGILENHIRPKRPGLQVLDVKSFSKVFSRAGCLCVNSWGGQTCLDMVYNDGYLTPDLIVKFVDGIVSQLERGLNISLEVVDSVL